MFMVLVLLWKLKIAIATIHTPETRLSLMEKEKEKGIHITTPLYQTCTTTIKDHYLSALG